LFTTAYRGLFLTQKNEARASASVITKKLAEKQPGAETALLTEQARVVAVFESLKAVNVAEATRALLTIGQALLAAYENLKATRALMDYDDLIGKAQRLLRSDGGASWVHYKLDGGIDHILVDEAQDTSPEQWDVIAALAGDFFAGAGRHEETIEAPRTMFAVGDEKQSIYSFQGADPARFDFMRAQFAGQVAAVDGRLQDVELATSYRSTQAVLSAVDAVFGQGKMADGLTWGDRPIRHTTARDGQGGLVELWPLVEPETVTETDPWDAPLDQISLQSPQARLAGRIAEQIDRWIKDEEILQSAKRPISPGDIMILVRTRAAFAEEMVRALKQVGVPVAGRDRMVLTDHIAIMDLMALGRFVLLPEDDLNTATVLKGPLIELDDDDLFDLAFERPGTLWAAFRAKAGGTPKYQAAFDKLSALLAGADYQPPYEFYAGLLGGGGLEALLAHTGTESREPVDEFLSLALRFEREHPPSLQGFLHWMDVGETQVKRDLEHGLGEVRVMTVHGAKGLQANVVFLTDTCSLPRPQHGPKIHWRDGGGEDEPAIVLWPAFRDNEETICRELRELAHTEAEREYRRLLYVAMTRARDRLYVAGWGSGDAPPEGCWYDMVAKARDDRWREIDLGDGLLGHRLTTDQTATPDSVSVELPLEGGGLALPAWAKLPAPDEPTPPQPLAPSRPFGDEPPVRSPMHGDDGARFKRGTLIHRLLQTLPDLDAGERRPAAARYLARPGHDLTADVQKAITEETLAVLGDPALASLFGPGSQAEVPIAGTSGEWVISGQVDRLVVSDDVVRVIDFKTNRPPPGSEAGVASVYLRQMAAYRDLLRQIYPERRVETVLLWTDGPRALRLSDEILDTAQP
jgi:ATP-dependent helicase/nuclease subunit A